MIELLLFLFFLFACLYIPGTYVLAKCRLQITPLERLFIPISIGLMIFILLAYVLSWLKLEIMILPLLMIAAVLAVKNRYLVFPKIEIRHRKPLFFVLVLSLLFGMSMLITGQFGDTFIYRHDDTWHLILINELKSHFPPDNPAISGVPLHGYHFFYNFLLAKISNIFSISPLSLHFHFFPVFLSLFWGIGVYTLMFRWSKKVSVAVWAVFLTMFGGSFAFLLILQGHPDISLNSGLGISQASGALNNPPFSISIVLLIAALFMIHEYLATKQKGWLVPLTLFTGLIAMYKVYAGMILMGGFLLLTGTELMKKRLFILVPLLAVAIIFFSTYWLFAGGSGYLIFHPFWPSQTLLQSFPWYGYDEKMYTYTRLHVIKGIVQTQLYGFNLFLFGNLGTRLFGIIMLLFLFIKKRKLPSLFANILACMALAAFLIPFLFIQSGKVFEIIQMDWYFLFFCSLFAAFGFSYLFSLKFNIILKSFLLIAIVAITLPSAYPDYMGYLQTITQAPIHNLSTPFFTTAKFLSTQGNYDATVLELPPEGTAPTDTDIVAWYRRATPLFLALADKRGYLDNEFIDFPGVNINPRLQFVKEIVTFSNTSATMSAYPKLQKDIRRKLKSNGIRYIYSPYENNSLQTISGVRQIFQQGSYTLYDISKGE